MVTEKSKVQPVPFYWGPFVTGNHMKVECWPGGRFPWTAVALALFGEEIWRSNESSGSCGPQTSGPHGHPKSFLKHSLLGSSPMFLIQQVWVGRRICTCKLPGDGEAAGPGTTL